MRQSWIPLLKKRSLPGRAFVMARKGATLTPGEHESDRTFENSCTACNALFLSDGSETPRLLFVAASPIDQAGDELLTRMIQAMGIQRGVEGGIVRVMVTGDCPMCAVHIQGELTRLQPEFVVALGSAAGVVQHTNVSTIAHPREILQNPEAKRQAWVELKRIMQELQA